VHDGRELAEAFIKLLNQPDERSRMGQAAFAAVQSGHGALERTIALLASSGL
jgi:spore maturation protein CgeB